MTSAALGLRIVPLRLGDNGWRLVERNYVVFRRSWPVFLTGFLEPVFYLLSIGLGVSRLVAWVHRIQWTAHRIHGVHSTRIACDVGHERSDIRLDIQRLLQAEVRQALRLHPGDAVGATRRGPRGR